MNSPTQPVMKKHVAKQANAEAPRGESRSTLFQIANMKSIMYGHRFFLLEDEGVSFQPLSTVPPIWAC